MYLYAPAPLTGGIIDANVGGAIPNQGVMDFSAMQNYMLGTIYRTKTGKEFRYAYNGATAIPLIDSTHGNLQQGPAVISNFVNKAQAVNYATAPVGATEIIVDVTTGSAIADNALAGGRLFVKTATGIGDAYEIVASKLDTYDTNLHLLLATPIRTAFVAGTYVTLRQNRWNGTIIAPTTLTGRLAGVCVASYNSTNGNVIPANYYYWAQTKGEAPVLIDGTVVIGQPVVASVTIPGGVVASAQTVVGTTSAVTAMVTPVGVVGDIGANTHVGLVDLNIV
jgi:hypothetical protein